MKRLFLMTCAAVMFSATATASFTTDPKASRPFR